VPKKTATLELDAMDRRILAALSRNGRLTMAELSAEVAPAGSTSEQVARVIGLLRGQQGARQTVASLP